MKKSENTTNYSIKSKLVAAAAMLLVATIMVVSSTYAWFTLSTAPEITGISTAVGANGALEMLLATRKADNSGWAYGEGALPSNATVIQRNTYWGNLVDLSDTSYGSQAITLYPSVLNLNNGKLNLGAPLQTPVYGPDGRVEKLAPGGSFANFNGNNFMEDKDYYGFRGLGVASGLTERQQAFRSAISAMATASYNAQNEARKSLSENGTPLANIAILKAMKSSTEDVFTQTDLDAIGSMISGLETALKQAEEAYVQAIIAYSLGNKLNHSTDLEALTLAESIRGAATIENAELNQKISAVVTLLGQDAAAIQAMLGYDVYKSAVENVQKAKAAHEVIVKADKYSWEDIKEALTALVNVDVIKINNIPANKVMQEDNKNQIASDILGGNGVQVVIPTGGGVYADIADLCGNYTVDVEIKSDSLDIGDTVKGLTIKATMKAESTNTEPYLTQVSDIINATDNYPTGTTAGALPLTELYGYVIDLAFRTNAAQSNLLLQTDAVDRIYNDNNNDETMGSGSTMTFKSSAPDFTSQKVKDLMSNLRVVFYSTEGENNMAEIYATAKLDVVAGVIEDANGITAKLYIYKNVEATKGTLNGKDIYKVGDKYYSLINDKSAFYDEMENPAIENIVLGTETVKIDIRDNVITALNQNAIKHISALVYLDGEKLTNADVAANVAQSITGSLNLQFASSATLTPMEYGNLHTTNKATATPTSEATPTPDVNN